MEKENNKGSYNERVKKVRDEFQGSQEKRDRG